MVIQGGEGNGKVSSCKLRYEIMQDILSIGSGFFCLLDSDGPKRFLWPSFGLVLNDLVLARDFLCITIRLQEHLLYFSVNPPAFILALSLLSLALFNKYN